jgi:predicted transposase/invertase (TIGR01784 family)
MVYPMLFWQSDGKYRAKRNIWDLFPYPELARRFWVDDYKLIDLQQIPDEELTKRPWAGLFQLVTKYVKRRNFLKKLDDSGGKLLKLIVVENNGKAFLVNVVRYVLTVVDKSGKVELENVLKKHLNQGNEIMGNVAQELIQEGISQGAHQKEQEIAKNLLKMGIPAADVARATGLSVSEVEKLKVRL